MDIYSYLQKNHEKVEDLFRQILAAKDSQTREALLQQVKEILQLQAEHEEAQTGDTLEKICRISTRDVANWLIKLGEMKNAGVDSAEKEMEKI